MLVVVRNSVIPSLSPSFPFRRIVFREEVESSRGEVGEGLGEVGEGLGEVGEGLGEVGAVYVNVSS